MNILLHADELLTILSIFYLMLTVTIPMLIYNGSIYRIQLNDELGLYSLDTLSCNYFMSEEIFLVATVQKQMNLLKR